MKKFLLWIGLPGVAMALVGLGFAFGIWGEKTEAGQNQNDRQVFLQTIGAMGAAQVHQTYLNIGFVGDGKAEEIYDAKDAKEILQSVLALHETVDKQFEKIAKLNLEPGDRKSLERLRTISGLLTQQGKELQAFWDTGNKERAASYEKTRQQAWEEISKLSGPAPKTEK